MDPNSEPARDGPHPTANPQMDPAADRIEAEDQNEAEDLAFEDSLFDALLEDKPPPGRWGGRGWSIALVPLGLAAAAYAVSRYLKRLGAERKA